MKKTGALGKMYEDGEVIVLSSLDVATENMQVRTEMVESLEAK